jgi:pyruvate dehydrogenase E1 component alpha subunit
MSKLKKEDLVKFEDEIIDCFNKKKIKAPIHLYSHNEEKMIEIFKKIKPNDWVLCSWRSHYQCLLKGVPKEIVKKRILQGKSIALCFKDKKIVSSAIVGGILPIAVGLGLANKLKKSKDKVFVFLGDMTSETGIAHESIKYSLNHGLEIYWIIEDNNKSVCTDTRKAWNTKKLTFEKVKNDKIIFYKYESKYPHAGSGVRIQF